MPRVILLVMDSFGIGASADADQFGGEGYTDVGSHTLGHIAEAFSRGDCDSETRSGPLHLPHLTALGLARASHASCGTWPAGLDRNAPITGGFAWAREISSGKDTPSGHWEIAGVPVLFDWSYFPKVPDCFPPDLLAAIEKRSGVRGSLGNCHASGTDIIARLGEEHMRTGTPIFYTSADSVFQIACHEQSFGLQKLQDLCIAAREVLDQSDLKIGRVIARPFVGTNPADFQRTGNRHDYSIPPPAPTILQVLTEAGGTVIGIGKIADIYAHTGITEEIRASGHPALWEHTLAALDRAPDRSVVMTNFVDFDALYGHRRDVAGYGTALETFDTCLPELHAKLQPGDLLIITADHGNDPTWHGTDHTREHVPILLAGDSIPPGTDFGGRHTFADIAQTIATHLQLPARPHGTTLL